MMMPDKKQIEMLRKEFPAGSRVELVEMDDVQAPPKGTQGTVIDVDDLGNLIMRWDNGSRLNVVFGADKVFKLAGGRYGD